MDLREWMVISYLFPKLVWLEMFELLISSKPNLLEKHKSDFLRF